MSRLREEAGGVGAILQFGDASLASPFTAKRPSISSCVDIIRQGRCTLTTTVQMYKILACSSLVQAYSMTMLFVGGVKIGDSQGKLEWIFRKKKKTILKEERKRESERERKRERKEGNRETEKKKKREREREGGIERERERERKKER